jgi:glycosyltransferase involved in cell wall biosynthesis
MRILHLVNTMNPEAGGPAEAVRMICENAPPGYANEVLTLDDPAAPFMARFPFPVHGFGPVRNSFGYTSRLLPWLRANRHRFDGVIVHGLWRYIGLAARRAFSGNTPYVVFTHGMLDPYFKHAFPLKHLKKWPYWLLNEYWLLRGAFRVLFTTAVERDLARQTFWLSHWTPFVVPLGASEPALATSSEAFFELLPEARGRRLLLFLGRIHPKKGGDLLLEAFARCAASAPDVDLVMAGPLSAPNLEAWRTRLDAIVRDAGLSARVHWPGMLHGHAKWGAFAASEAFILPSHQENFGIAVVEALGCGRPVLISDKINIAPEIAADRCGLVEPDTLEGTIKLFERWFALAPAERSAMSTRALATFSTRYNMRRNTETILRVFEKTHPNPAS